MAVPTTIAANAAFAVSRESAVRAVIKVSTAKAILAIIASKAVLSFGGLLVKNLFDVFKG